MAESAIDPRSLLPLKPDVFSILLTLLEGNAHGYSMIKAADARDGRRGHLQPGSLYRLLKQMLAADLVAEVPDGEIPAGSDERRRYYRITPFGREVAAAESRRMAELVRDSRRLALLDEGELA